jgi:hypothetical protein
MGSELIVRMVTIAAGVFTVVAVSALVFGY